MQVHIVSAPYAIATKLEAFDNRGDEDFAASRDLEDFIAIVDGRDGLLGQVSAAGLPVRLFIATRTARLLQEPRFLDALPGHLPGDEASQARIGVLMRRRREIAALR
jgi:hypothetical protein